LEHLLGGIEKLLERMGAVVVEVVVLAGYISLM